MKKVLVSLFLTFVCAFIIVAILSFNQKATQILSYSKCDKPTQYKLGSIDSRFGLNQSEALNNIRQAANVWDNANARNLFTYADNADLTVNFVYDERQALDSQINKLKTTLNHKNSTLEQQISEYKARVASFEKRLSALNAEINKYNQQGGAPPDVYNELIKEQNELKAEGDALNAWAKELNFSANDYNAGVYELNKDVSQFNNAISEKPEEGIYDGESNTITIYFVGNRSELLHTLAHEFGHALGMDHVVNAAGIMYPYTTTSLIVTADDAIQLNYACREHSLFIYLIQEFDIWLIDQYKNVSQNF